MVSQPSKLMEWLKELNISISQSQSLNDFPIEIKKFLTCASKLHFQKSLLLMEVTFSHLSIETFSATTSLLLGLVRS